MASLVSRKLVIGLVAVVALNVYWWGFGRTQMRDPGAAAIESAVPADGAAAGEGTSLTEAPDQARQAANASDAQTAETNAAMDAAAGAPSTGVAPAVVPSTAGAATASGTAGSDTPLRIDPGAPASEASILRHLEDGKVLVLLFWNASSADDRAARRAVGEATKGRGGDVSVRIINAKRIGDYQAITGGVIVAQTPTTVIIGPERKAVTITGLVDSLEVRQAIGRMASGKG
jgi:hypothetical protein